PSTYWPGTTINSRNIATASRQSDSSGAMATDAIGSAAPNAGGAPAGVLREMAAETSGAIAVVSIAPSHASRRAGDELSRVDSKPSRCSAATATMHATVPSRSACTKMDAVADAIVDMIMAAPPRQTPGSVA